LGGAASGNPADASSHRRVDVIFDRGLMLGVMIGMLIGAGIVLALQ
jgi:hypothetical protein